MLSHQEVLKQALELRVAIDDLRSATYIVDNFTDENQTPYMFIASFDMDAMEYSFNITDANFIEVKGVQQASPETIVAFGVFIANMRKYVAGGEHPYADKLAVYQPNIVNPMDELKDEQFPSDRDIDDSEAQL